ncbi:RNA-binding cell elongation regulator Jag/EloR [Clostridium hydrogeniformans]|uniref:RNA-binding cell elongation regulator Jag/EloR n=1 Tax=Clostridium hydrogeniformans TaxID=349933 RepID=UPI000485A878|nr:RNA-binding cell elongation regulator Jag/EloR [Clostridium hydrogeniformans]
MKTLEISGKTVDEALKSALKELNVTEDKVEVEVLEQGSKGLLGLIGAKPAKILVKLKNNYADSAREFLGNVLDSMGVKAEIQIKEEKDTIKISLEGPNMGVVIGYRGETLDSLQYLVSLVINKGNDEQYKRVVLDSENYRAKREETLKRLASKTAYKVNKNGRCFRLEAMNPYERRIIHAALQNHPDVYTYSEGDEPFRRVVVEVKKKKTS